MTYSPQSISRVRAGDQVVSPMSVANYATEGESRRSTHPKIERQRGWLIKTEPHTWSWDDQVTKGITFWDGVRNYQASNNLKAMKLGDICLFYHSGDERQIMGMVEVVKTYYPDPSDPSGRFGMVDVKVLKSFHRPVTLKAIKEDPRLQHLALVRQSRLSVMPIDEESWEILTQMGNAQ